MNDGSDNHCSPYEATTEGSKAHSDRKIHV